MRIFISNVLSDIGLQLVQSFRNDHLCSSNTNTIVGTAQEPQEHRACSIISFEKNSNFALRCALQSDIIVLNIRQFAAENELILKYMLNLPKNANRKIILISSFETWANTHNQLKDYGDMHALEGTTQPQRIQEDMWKGRVPSHTAQYQWQLEVMAEELHRRGDNIKIVTAGIVYGHSYDELQSKFVKCLRNQPLTIEQPGNNNLPMIHVLDLAAIVSTLPENDALFHFAAECTTTQEQLVQYLHEKLHNSEQPVRKQSIIPTTINMIAQCQFKLSHPSILQHNILEQFCKYRQYEPIVIVTDRQIDRLPILNRQFVVKYIESTDSQTIREKQAKEKKEYDDKILEESQKKKKYPDKEPPAPYSFSNELIKLALEEVIEQFKFRNFQLVVDNLIKEEYVRHLNTYKLCFKEEQLTDKSILYSSQEYKRLLGIQTEQKEEPKIMEPERVEEQPKHQDPESVQITNLKQYLIDMVMPSVTAAIVNVQQNRPKDIVLDFVQELRKGFQLDSKIRF